MRQEICCRVPGLPIISVRNRGIEDHAGFMRRLNKQHGRQHGFWGLIKDQGACPDQ